MPGPNQRGRAAASNPANRFERLYVEDDAAEVAARCATQLPTTVLAERAGSVLSRNDSPDLGFTYSINPYRGCEHGCIYCYARPHHEYLGFSAGLDFETTIVAKTNVATQLASAFRKPSWQPQVVVMSGSTDPYQPAERRLQLARQCLEVARDFRNPVAVITKSHLVTRDTDVLAELAEHTLTQVFVSITTLRDEVAGLMEPRAARPQRRLEVLRALAGRGIPVGVMVAPVVPGLTDEEMPAILEQAAHAGATRAGYIVVRLPQGVRPLFLDWLTQCFPERKTRVVRRLAALRGARLTDSRFGTRMRGEGPWADVYERLFTTTCARLGLNRSAPPPLSTAHFRRDPRQPGLF